MRLKLLGLLAVTVLVSPAALAVDEIGPGGTWSGGSFGILYTPPLAEGEQYSAPIEYHPQGTYTWGNWVGVGFGIDYDPTEVNFVGVTAGPGLLATSSGGATVTIWNPGGATQLPPQSSVFTLANVTFNAQNTTTANNGDVDITFDGGGMYHPFNIYGATPFSGWVTYMAPSNLLYVGFTPGGQPMTASQWAPGVEMGEGTWIHNTTYKEVTLLAGMFWGRATDVIAQGGIGVEHVPEPAAAILVLGGIGALVVARRRRRA